MFFSWSRTRLRLVLDHEKTFYNLHLIAKNRKDEHGDEILDDNDSTLRDENNHVVTRENNYDVFFIKIVRKMTYHNITSPLIINGLPSYIWYRWNRKDP